MRPAGFAVLRPVTYYPLLEVEEAEGYAETGWKGATGWLAESGSTKSPCEP